MQISEKIGAALTGLKQRILKLNRGNGPYDPRTAYDVAPFGVDSTPPDGWRAIYAKTAVAGNEVIVGYINQNATALPGELKLYSVGGGDEAITLILRTNGTMELGGNTKHLARYEELAIAYNSLKQSVTDLTILFNTHVHNIVLPTPATPVTVPLAFAVPPTGDITGAKINELKTL